MQTEFEIRVLEIDPREVQERILFLGGKEISPRTLQRRYVYDTIPAQENKWLRLRVSNGRSTLTLKTIENASISGTKESEVDVSDFDEMHLILLSSGFTARSYQENYRHSFRMGDVSLEIDQWPQARPWLEVEASSEALVMETLKQLKLEAGTPTTEGVSAILKSQYGLIVEQMQRYCF